MKITLTFDLPELLYQDFKSDINMSITCIEGLRIDTDSKQELFMNVIDAINNQITDDILLQTKTKMFNV